MQCVVYIATMPYQDTIVTERVLSCREYHVLYGMHAPKSMTVIQVSLALHSVVCLTQNMLLL